jgi:arsenate reductase
MAEGLLRHDAGSTFEVFSAGTKPTRVRPEAISVMHEVGIDISGHRSKSVDEFAGQNLDYPITVCDNAKESCPIFPARTKRIHCSIEDPAAVQGSEKERLNAFRRARDELRARLQVFAQGSRSCPSADGHAETIEKQHGAAMERGHPDRPVIRRRNNPATAGRMPALHSQGRV